MGKLYLKEINKNDLYLLEKYNEDILSHQLKPSITSDSFVDWLQKMETSRSDSTKVHFFPYFLMLDDIPIGMPIIKTNIDVDEFWLKYGGNISYVISPSYRRKGYGTKCLHLVLEECLRLGLTKAFLTCDARNTGSFKIIQNNYGILENSFIDNRAHLGTLNYRFSIDIPSSLKQYENKYPPNRPTLNELCNLDRTDVSSFLINAKQSEIDKEKHILSLDENTFDYIVEIHTKYVSEFKYDEHGLVDEFSRTVGDIIKSNTFYGNNEVALVFSSLLRENGIPAICIFASNIDTKETRTFLEIYLNNKWFLFDPFDAKLYLNYDYNNLCLPNNYYVYRKSLNNFNFGIFTKEEMKKLIGAFADTYNNPQYECIELNNLKEIEIKKNL